MINMRKKKGKASMHEVIAERCLRSVNGGFEVVKKGRGRKLDVNS